MQHYYNCIHHTLVLGYTLCRGGSRISEEGATRDIMLIQEFFGNGYQKIEYGDFYPIVGNRWVSLVIKIATEELLLSEKSGTQHCLCT